MLDAIRVELSRIAAREVRVSLDEEFESKVGTTLRVERDMAYWHLLPEHFLELLKELPDGAGAESVHRAIEKHAVGVWHGPSPTGSRDTSS